MSAAASQPDRVVAQGASFTLSDGSESALAASSLECENLGGTWSSGSLTCTVTGIGGILSGTSLEIGPGVELVIAYGGIFTNSGNIEDNGSVTVSGSLTNSVGGVITVSGTLTNNPGGSITNDGEFTNDSTGVTINSGALSNTPGGKISNSRDFYNPGAIGNGGTFTSSCPGQLDERGTFTGAPPTTCETTSSSSPSVSTGPSSQNVELGAALVVAAFVTALAVALSGVDKRSET